MRKLLLTSLIFYLFLLNISGQDKYASIQDKLVILSTSDIPALNEKVNISVTNVSIQEFLRGIATSSGLNINVDPNLKIEVVNNFSDVKVIDILLFLCRQYDLDISVIGNIINVFKDKPEAPPVVPKELVTYDESDEYIGIQCDNEDLGNVVKEIVDKTGYNLVPAPGLDKIKVSGYIQNMPIDDALDKFAFANNLKITKSDDGVYLIEKNEPTSESTVSPLSRNDREHGKRTNSNNNPENLKFTRLSKDSIAIQADDASLSDIVIRVATELKKDYILLSPLKGESTFCLKGTDFPSLLQFLFQNTSYAFQVKDGVYIIGEDKSREMKEFKVIQLQNRPVDTVLAIIPQDLKKDMEIKSFTELNSLLVGGTPDRIKGLEAYIRSIDKTIPVISIEVMIIDVTNTKGINSGISAGLGTSPAQTQGTVAPGVGTTSQGFTLSSQSVNNLINSFNGFGVIKLGNVTPNFYMSLQALQTNGVLNIRSTPKLSTLNGHSATMSITDYQYYQEQTNNIYGTLSAQSTTLTAYKEQKAEMSVKIRPVVSGDDQITMEIEVNQEDFTSRLSQYAPYGKTARKFKSLIRVKNGEMILLGGLEEKRDNNNNSGLPVLSRIPILKWFFSNVNNTDSHEKLNIFIKPTIIN